MVTFGHRHSMELPREARSAHAAFASQAGEEDPVVALSRRLEASRAGMEARLVWQIEAESARHRTAVRLTSLLLIPETIWRGRHGKFLLHTLALNPYDAWNVLISPLDAESAALIATPLPRADAPTRALERCNALLTEARRRYADALDLTDWANDFANVERARASGRADVHALAMALRDELLHPRG